MGLGIEILSVQAVVRDKKAGNAYSAAGDDDINDVAAMGGVNLAEEANRILGATDNVGTVVRSCKDETFLQTGLLHQRITRICKEKVRSSYVNWVYCELTTLSQLLLSTGIRSAASRSNKPCVPCDSGWRFTHHERLFLTSPSNLDGSC